MSRTRITKLAFMIVFVCFLFSTFVSLWSLRLMARQNMEELSKTLSARIYDRISRDLAGPITAAQTMSHDSLLKELLENETEADEAETVAKMERYLSGIMDGMGYEAAFVVSEGSRRYYSYNGLNKIVDTQNNDRDQWYLDFLAADKPYVLDVDRDEVSHDAWTVFVDHRIEDDNGGLLGVCGVGVQMWGSQTLFKELESEYDVKVDLVDENGIVKVGADIDRVEQPLGETIQTRKSDEYVYQRRGLDGAVVTKYVDRLGWYLVVQSDGSSARDQVLNLILLYVVVCLVMMVLMVIAIRIILERTRALAHASLRDQPTQLLNRRAFEEEKEKLASAELGENFVYMTADINGLKTANDTLGHAAGDELIKGAAKCLKEAFGSYGKIFRIGGDEFAAMLTMTREQLAAATADFERRVGEWKGEKVERLSVSCGYALGREHPSENIADLGRISDEMMYAAKERHYRETGEKRRQSQ